MLFLLLFCEVDCFSGEIITPSLGFFCSTTKIVPTDPDVEIGFRWAQAGGAPLYWVKVQYSSGSYCLVPNSFLEHLNGSLEGFVPSEAWPSGWCLDHSLPGYSLFLGWKGGERWTRMVKGYWSAFAPKDWVGSCPWLSRSLAQAWAAGRSSLTVGLPPAVSSDLSPQALINLWDLVGKARSDFYGCCLLGGCVALGLGGVKLLLSGLPPRNPQ
jgi:hypothetical protein